MALKKPISLNTEADNLESRFDRLESKFDEFIDFVTIQFQKVEQRFDSIDQLFEKVDERLDKLENRMDFSIGELKEMRQENIVAAHRSHRIESWVIKASKKINLPYHP